MKKVLLIVIALFIAVLTACGAASGESKGDTESGALIAVLVTFIVTIVLIPTVSITNKVRRNLNLSKLKMNMSNNLSEFVPSHDETFEDNLKSAKLKPQKVITFGQNRIAIDSMKKKIFVRSSEEIDGVLLDYKDIVSYEIIKDGKTIGRSGGGYIDSEAAAGESGIICSDLRLVITTKTHSEVVLPFISFSIDSEFAYKEALDAAKEAAQVLDNIIAY